jgi:hypothetical protein
MKSTLTHGKVTHAPVAWEDPWFRVPPTEATEMVLGVGWEEWYQAQEPEVAVLHRAAAKEGIDPALMVAWAPTQPTPLRRE